MRRDLEFAEFWLMQSVLIIHEQIWADQMLREAQKKALRQQSGLRLVNSIKNLMTSRKTQQEFSGKITK
jgi:hypothetical protein